MSPDRIARSSGAGREPPDPDLAVKVLALDDDRQFLAMLRSALVEEGYEVSTATTGEAGLKVVREAAPDVILLDVRMPHMNGLTFARQYARLPGRHAPIIVISGAEGRTGATVQNAVAYLSKPFELDALLGLLRQVDRVA